MLVTREAQFTTNQPEITKPSVLHTRNKKESVLYKVLHQTDDQYVSYSSATIVSKTQEYWDNRHLYNES